MSNIFNFYKFNTYSNFYISAHFNFYNLNKFFLICILSSLILEITLRNKKQV